ncbi:sugar ABC transporter permease [uncultured Acetatifactor sp.]|uniref:ABC transporter permease n=1 Tax=uncultured Acetatifactor sp. TaxID=1671927 RepID=UPI00261C0349|nr:ABC transporter permease subunit [uncultured Acetatifactor sp.]
MAKERTRSKHEIDMLELKRAKRRRAIKENATLYLFMLPGIVLLFLFCYRPMYGILIAFQDYLPGKPIIGEGVRWVGLKHIKGFMSSYYFRRLIRNTLVLSVMNLIFVFPVPIIFALVINEIIWPRTKKVIQTITYLPHFISTVVVAGMVTSFLADDGIITLLLKTFGLHVSSMNTNASAFPWIYTFIKVWQSFGWGSILYLSTMSSIDPGLYEAAEIDGASRLKRIRHITLPALMPLIMIQLILFIGSILGNDSNLILLLYSPATYETADVIGTYTYREGLLGGQFSSGTAIGLFMSIIGFILTFISNKISDKTTGFALW